MDIKIKLSGLAIILLSQHAVAAPISGYDQFTLELLNDVRANPGSYANTYLVGNLNEGLSPGTISAGAKQPLAWNLNLVNSAQSHTADMVASNFFSHTGSNNSTTQSRIENSGFDWQTYGENLAARGQTGIGSISSNFTEQLNIDLFVDTNIADRGHRTNMLNNDFEVVGISVGYSPKFSALQDLPSNLVTLDFGANSSGSYLTGVAYNDTDKNNFYTPGEGLGGLSVLAYEAGTSNIAGSTQTFDAGGYSLDLGAGTYDLQITGSLGSMLVQNIQLGNQNLKFDYTNATVVPVPAAVWLFASGLLGMINFKRRKLKVA